MRSVLAVIALSSCLLSCGGEDLDQDPVGGPQQTDDAYVPPADRIDPAAVRKMSNDEIVQLGLGRSGHSGVGTKQRPSKRRYVSAADGDDDDDGSEKSPWRTLQHAADSVGPDTEVLVDDSGDYRGGLEITRGGDESGYIVFRGLDPERMPTIAGDSSSDAVVNIDASYIVFQGFEIAEHTRSSLKDDSYGINIEPESVSIGHLEIRNNIVRDIGPSDLDERSCNYNGHGIIAQSEGYVISDLIIDGNELHDLYVGNSECLVINGDIDGFWVTNNFVHDVNNIAIDIIGYEKNSSETTRNGYVADNIILDSSNGWPYCSRGNCTYPEGDESADGIYVDGGADIVIEYNVVGRADHGIELQSENGELIRHVEVAHNAVFNSHYRNFTLGDNKDSFEHDNEFFDEPSLASDELQSCL